MIVFFLQTLALNYVTQLDIFEIFFTAEYLFLLKKISYKIVLEF
jgi:hypothetical protein